MFDGLESICNHTQVHPQITATLGHTQDLMGVARLDIPLSLFPLALLVHLYAVCTHCLQSLNVMVSSVFIGCFCVFIAERAVQYEAVEKTRGPY